MTPRGRLPKNWGDSPPDRLAGCTVAFIKMLGIGLVLAMIGSAAADWLFGR